MSVSNIQTQWKESFTKISLAAGRTLTYAETNAFIITGTTAITVTLPTGVTGMGADRLFKIRNRTGAAGNVTVVVAAGFGGGGGSHDTLTLAAGEEAAITLDGGYYYVPTGAAAA